MRVSRSLVGLLVGAVMALPASANEKVVRTAFRDTPILIKIALCESEFRQFDEDGTVLKNPGSTAIGVMQIMSSYHAPIAKDEGYDITTLAGNLGYAKWLYEKEGTTPWDSSVKCWG